MNSRKLLFTQHALQLMSSAMLLVDSVYVTFMTLLFDHFDTRFSTRALYNPDIYNGKYFAFYFIKNNSGCCLLCNLSVNTALC